MESPRIYHVVAAERIDDGVIITFDDGRCALYPAMLLYGMFSMAVQVSALDEDQWPPEGEAGESERD